MFGAYACDVLLALAHVLAPLHHYGAKAKFYEAQCGKQSTGTCTHHDDRLGLADVGIIYGVEKPALRFLAHEGTHRKVHEDGTLACINTAFEHLHGIGPDALLALQVGKDPAYVVCLAGSDGQEELAYHS